MRGLPDPGDTYHRSRGVFVSLPMVLIGVQGTQMRGRGKGMPFFREDYPSLYWPTPPFLPSPAPTVSGADDIEGGGKGGR